MALVNEHFLKLPGSYLFSDIAKKINTFRITHPKKEAISSTALCIASMQTCGSGRDG